VLPGPVVADDEPARVARSKADPELLAALQDVLLAGASDLHVSVGAPPMLRIDGVLRETTFDLVEPEEAERVALAIMPPRRAERFQDGREADFVYSAPGRGRFRVSAFRQRGWVGLGSYRMVPAKIPKLDELGLRNLDAIRKLLSYHNGLILITGPVGAGKTTTLAAMVAELNEQREDHIITVEDPIEVLHPDKRSIVTQREVGTDTVSFRDAIVHALRQDPDVVFVSALPDAPTARAALEAADVGHFVLASMSTVSATDTVSQLIELFPHERPQIRGLLAAFAGSSASGCCPGRWCGRVPAVEVLVVNSGASEALLGGRPTGSRRSCATASTTRCRPSTRACSTSTGGLVERDAALHPRPRRRPAWSSSRSMDAATVNQPGERVAGALGPAGRTADAAAGGLPMPVGRPSTPRTPGRAAHDRSDCAN
jgi:twitching motility protein PilT